MKTRKGVFFAESDFIFLLQLVMYGFQDLNCERL